MSSSEDCWKYAWVNNLLGHLTREFVVNIVGCRGDGVGEGRENVKWNRKSEITEQFAAKQI